MSYYFSHRRGGATINVQKPIPSNIQQPITTNVQQPITTNVQEPSIYNNIGKTAYTGMVWYGKFQTLGPIIFGICGMISFIYGIKLFFTND